VIVGKSGQVTAAITARDVVAMGRLWGKVTASGRVDIRSESIVSCDISAARMSMEDGAIFNGSIDIREAAIEVAEIEVSIADVPERSGARLGFAPALELAS
jgi:cytoskeletal protein CcmA (bactofilin family)